MSDGELTIVKNADGALTLEGAAPSEVAFQPEALRAIRQGESGPWCTIESVDGYDVVVMRLCPIELRYRLTGDTDVTGSPCAERIDDDGKIWNPHS